MCLWIDLVRYHPLHCSETGAAHLSTYNFNLVFLQEWALT